MKFPRFPDDMRRSYVSVGLVEDIADREREFATHYDSTIDPYSVRLGRLCLELVDGDEATNGLPNYQSNRSHLSQPEVRVYDALRRLALFACNSERAEKAQRNLHNAAVGVLEEVTGQRDAKQRATMSEYVTLGLLTRYAHPNMLAYPALQHHECDTDTPGHYDIGVIVNNPGNVIESNHIQVKLACFGICRGEAPSSKLQEFQAHYRPSVQLLSACCHLQAFSRGLNKDRLAHQLIAERLGTLDKTAIKQLDNTTDSFVLAMTTEQLPRGLHGGTSVGLAAEDFLSRL